MPASIALAARPSRWTRLSRLRSVERVPLDWRRLDGGALVSVRINGRGGFVVLEHEAGAVQSLGSGVSWWRSNGIARVVAAFESLAAAKAHLATL